MELRHFWSEIRTKDNALHITAGVPVIAAFHALGIPLVLSAAMYGLHLYIREVTQVQTTRKWTRFFAMNLPPKMNGKEGWLLDFHHWMECLVPTVALVVASWIIDLTIN